MSWWLLTILSSAAPLSAVSIEVVHSGETNVMRKEAFELASVADQDTDTIEVKGDGSEQRVELPGQANGQPNSLIITSEGNTFNPDAMKRARETVADAAEEDESEEDPSYNHAEEEDVHSDFMRQIVTSEQEAKVDDGKSLLPGAEKPDPVPEQSESKILRLGDGLGGIAYESPYEGSPTGSRNMNRAMRLRLEFQDMALVGIMLLFFVVTIAVSCFNVYHFAEDQSPACFYTKVVNRDRLMCEVPEATHFLQAFNGQPPNCRLRILGRTPDRNGVRRVLRSMTDSYGRHRSWNRHPWHNTSILFDVALDVSPFITGAGRLEDKQMALLERFLAPDKANELEVMVLQKYVDWEHWEDLATNIKQRLRSLGFMGDVELLFENYDEVKIYPNNRWSNFVRSNVTQALMVLSVVGGLVWMPYVWSQRKTVKVESRFKVNLEPERYWDLVQEGLNAAEGFQCM